MSSRGLNRRTLDDITAGQLHQHIAKRLEGTAQQAERDCRWQLGRRCDVAVLLRDVAGAVLRVRAELAAEAAATCTSCGRGPTLTVPARPAGQWVTLRTDRRRRGDRRGVHGLVAGIPARPVKAGRTGDDLTGREMQVLEALSRGRTFAQIATELDTGLQTVKTQCARLRSKLEAHDQAHAVALGYQQGLLTLPDDPLT